MTLSPRDLPGKQAGSPATLLNAVAVAGAGTGYKLFGPHRSAQVIISGTLSLDIEVSNDNTNWEKILTGITASAMYDIGGAYVYTRGNVTSYTSGSATVIASSC